MSTRRVALAALVVLPLALAGCKINTINSFPVKSAHVRTVNVMAGAPTLEFAAEGTPKWPAVAFEGSTDFVDLDNKDTSFSVTQPSATSPLLQASFSLAGEQTYTLIAYGVPGSAGLLLLPDATSQPGSGRTQLRVANTAVGIGTMDVYVTAPGVDLTTVGANMTGLGYGGATSYLQFSPGTYQIRITVSGTQTVIYDSGPRTFSDNTSTDLIAYARTSGRLPNALLLDVNGAGQRVVADNTLASVKFLHAMPQAGNVNINADTGTLFSNLPYPQPTGYATIAAGARAFAFEATATPGVPIATAAPTLAPASDTTIVATGLAGSTRTLVLTDDNVPPAAGNARVRFVNAGIGVGPLDVFLNDTKQVSALATDAASPYLEVGPAAYTVSFRDPATGTVRATVSGVALAPATTSTVAAVGTADALAVVASQDD